MEPETRDFISGGFVALLAWVWHRLNGDVKAAKGAAEIVAQNSISRQDFKEYATRADLALAEIREAQERIFTKLEAHSAADAAVFITIAATLARLEERTLKK